MRLNQYIAQRSTLSRRKADEAIALGKVLVDGAKVKTLGFKLDPETSEVMLAGQLLEKRPSKLVYIAVNKPVGYVSTTKDTHGRDTVMKLTETKDRLYIVGRLDQESEGLILLTNDGAVTFALTHPSHHIPKTYLVEVRGKLANSKLERFKKGVLLSEGVLSKADVEVLSKGEVSLLKIVLHEGRNRQIRRTCAILKLHVVSLKRISIGPIQLGDLKVGDSRPLTDHEVILIQSLSKNQ